MIFTADDPRANTAKVLDEQGNDLSKRYIIGSYNTDDQTAGIYEYYVNVRGQRLLKTVNGLPVHRKIHLPGTRLVLAEPLKKAE
jgi:hypothetical protein